MVKKTLHCRRAGFEPQRIVVKEEGKSPPSTRRSRPSLNDDPSLCAALYTFCGVGELYRRQSPFIEPFCCADHLPIRPSCLFFRSTNVKRRFRHEGTCLVEHFVFEAQVFSNVALVQHHVRGWVQLLDVRRGLRRDAKACARPRQHPAATIKQRTGVTTKTGRSKGARCV